MVSVSESTLRRREPTCQRPIDGKTKCQEIDRHHDNRQGPLIEAGGKNGIKQRQRCAGHAHQQCTESQAHQAPGRYEGNDMIIGSMASGMVTGNAMVPRPDTISARVQHTNAILNKAGFGFRCRAL